MNSHASNDPIIIGSYGFNVPCRRFLVTANVTRDRRIPIVDEFLLRLLKLCERLPVKRIGAFFGFSAAETEAVMADLSERGLVVLDGDFVGLHPAAHDMFRGATDGVPRMIEIDAWVDRIWFDLVSRNMMAPERQRPLRNLIDLRADPAGREMPTAFVRVAFEENFTDYLKRVKRINDPERFGLYSISDVEPERFGSVILKGTEEIVFDPEPHIRPKLFEVGIENLARYRELTNAMLDAYRQLWWPPPSVSALEEFQRLIGDTSVADAHVSGAFDLRTWLSRNEGISVDWQPIIGVTYLKRNMEFVAKLIEHRLKSDPSARISSEASLTWFRPGGTAWGTSPELQETVASIRAAIRSAAPRTPLRTTLVVPSVVRRESAKRFDRIFDEAYFAPAAYMSPSIEAILVDDIAAVVTVRVAFSTNVATSVGYVTIDRASVQRIVNAFQWDATKKRAEESWIKPRETSEEEEVWTEGDTDIA
jgi:hypothetical protein